MSTAWAGEGAGMFRFERRGGALAIAADSEPPEPELAGVRCSRCLTELRKGELFGVCGGRVVCGECADEEWSDLTAAEKLELLGFEVIIQ